MKKQNNNTYEAKYRMLLDLAVDAFFQGDQNGNLILVNDKAVQLTGYSRAELLKMNISDLFSEKVLHDHPLKYDDLQSGNTVKTNRELRRKDGNMIRVEMISKKMPDDTYQSFFRDLSQRTLTEKALAESMQRYKKLHNSMIDGFVMTNMEGIIIDSNESYRQMLGYSENELRNLTYKELTPEKWHSLEDKIVSDQILPNGYSAVYEKEYIRKDKIVIPVELRTFLVCDEQGIIEGMGAIVRDITERKRAESLIMESEEKYRSIVESSLTAMLFYELNGEGQLIFQGSNPAADRILGISHESLVGLTLGEAFPNLRNTTIPELYTRIALGETGPQSFEIQYEDERFSGFFFVHVFKTGLKTITVDFIDITERRKSEQAIRRSEVEYRDTLNSLPDWIYVVDSSFKIVMINASLDDAMTSGASNVNRIGGRIVVGPPFVSLEDISVVMTVFNSGSIVVRRQKITHLGREIFTEITVVPIRKGREVVKVIVIIRDRSKEMEIEKLKQRSADQKEVLLREIHHRVKNNLSIVISLLSFQLNDNENPIIKRSLIDIQTRIRAMALIHEHLYRSENLDRIPLATYVSSLVQMVISTFSGNNVRIEYHLIPIESSIETALPVGLIINELLTNAFKYAFPDKTPGTILVGLSEAEEDFCLITVSDNGVGLPANFIPESSSSLGMYIVRLLAEQLDGTLQIDRTNGTTFNIRFRNMIRKSQITIY